MSIKRPPKKTILLSTAFLSMGAVISTPHFISTTYAEESRVPDLKINNIYVDGFATDSGDGTENKPFKLFEDALKYAKKLKLDGDSLVEIHLKNNTVVSNNNDLIMDDNKSYILNGHGHTLTVRGTNLEIRQPITFLDVNLSFLRDGSTTLPTILVKSPDVKFDKVTTIISGVQEHERPNLKIENGGVATFVNSTSNTKFNEIKMGDGDNNLTVDKEVSAISAGVSFEGKNSHVITDSSKLVTFNGTSKDNNNKLTIQSAPPGKFHISNIDTVNLEGNKERQSSLLSGIRELNIEGGLSHDDRLNVDTINGDGGLKLPLEENALLTKHLSPTLVVLFTPSGTLDDKLDTHVTNAHGDLVVDREGYSIDKNGLLKKEERRIVTFEFYDDENKDGIPHPDEFTNEKVYPSLGDSLDDYRELLDEAAKRDGFRVVSLTEERSEEGHLEKILIITEPLEDNDSEKETPDGETQPGGSVTPGAPNGTGTDDDTEKPNTGDSTVTPPAPVEPGTGEGSNPVENTGTGEGPKPGVEPGTEVPGDTGSPEKPGTDNGTGDTGNPGSTEKPKPEVTPGAGEQPGGSVTPGAPNGTGTDDDTEKPNTGDSTVTPPAPVEPGTGEGSNPGENTGTGEGPKPGVEPGTEVPGDTGSPEKPGTDNGTGDTGNPGSTEKPKPEVTPGAGEQPGVTGTGTDADSEKPKVPGDNENLVKPEKPESPKPDGDSTVTPPAPGKDTDSTTPGVEPGTEVTPSEDIPGKEPGSQPGVDTTKPNDSNIMEVTENSTIITPKEIDHKLVENIGDTTVEVLIKDLDSKNYKLKVKDVTKEHEADVLSKISEKVDSIKIFDINLLDVNTETIVKTDKDRTVRVLLTENLEDKTVKVYYVDDITGELTLVPSSVENNTVVFSVNHFSKYAVTISKNNDNQKLPNTGGLSNNNSMLGIITMIIALGMSYIRRVFKK